MAGEQIADARIDELDSTIAAAADRPKLALEDLSQVPLTIAAELGRTKTRVRDVLNLRVGSLVTLEKIAGEMADITVNGLNFARGEVVVIGDMLHVRIAEVIGGPERTERNHA